MRVFSSLFQALKRLRRLVSRSEWSVRLLDLTRTPETRAEPGLILIQIDGLSRSQYEHALDAGRLPFLKRLQDKEGYQLRTFYTGLPSSTPAVQGELFYGVRCAVPAFGFQDHETGTMRSMFHPQDAEWVQQRLQREGEGLFMQGSVYADLYTGGARLASFCTTRLGLGTHLTAPRWSVLLSTFLLHGFMLLRSAMLLIIEMGLTGYDVLVGLRERKTLWKEFTFIPARIGISIMLRELATAGVMIDAARGIPVIHCNFLGYDEQSHRRGPSSAFAHWTLKGIDACIRRIWCSARRSSCRDYDLWIYSDHGQEAVTPYADRYQKSVHDAIDQVLQQQHLSQTGDGSSPETIQLRRAKLLGGQTLQQLLRQYPSNVRRIDAQVTAKGPVGHLYIDAELDADTRAWLGRALVDEAHLPVVISRRADDTITAWFPGGEVTLPEDIELLVGEEHPFLEALREDIMRVVQHPDAGTFVFFGWYTGASPLSFPQEHGAHAGFGREETRGFTLLPTETPLPARPHEWLRPLELREAVLRHLGRQEKLEPKSVFARRAHDPERLRIMTYNVHSCVGLDHNVSPARIARIIAHYAPDIVALQEVDVFRRRTQHVDQACQIAGRLNMHYHFHPSFRVEEEEYGNAVLSRYPLTVKKVDSLPGKPDYEPRGALWVTIECGQQIIQFITTHLGLRSRERVQQIQTLLSTAWLRHPECRAPIIVCGDFNTRTGSPVYRAINAQFRDCYQTYPETRFPGTWRGKVRLDYIFITPDMQVNWLSVPTTLLTRKASDHFPVIADVHLNTTKGKIL